MTEEKYLIGIDQSTSQTKVVLVNNQGDILIQVAKEHQQYYPEPGWLEHDPEEIFVNVLELLHDIIDQAKSEPYFIREEEFAGVSITNQRETIVFWDAETRKSLCRGIVWQCRRSVAICEAMKAEGYEAIVEQKTGLKLDPYFSASKVKWALENIEEVARSKAKGTLRIGTIDAWLIYNLTQGEMHKTDYTNASRTMLFNIHTLSWDEELLKLFGVEASMLPEILDCDATYGFVPKGYLTKGVLPIAGVIGDSQGALFGQQCFEVGTAKATFGTGSSILMYLGQRKVISKKGLVTSLAWGVNHQVSYALEGVINSSGDTLKWLKEQLGIFSQDDEIGPLIDSLSSSEGVYIVPAFSGLSAPHWSSQARAAIVGLTRRSGKAHLVRAAVESMALQVYDLMTLMEEESGHKLIALNVDGGATKNRFLLQLLADLLEASIQPAVSKELSVLGAVYLGGLGLGIWESMDDLKKLKKNDILIMPAHALSEFSAFISGWQHAVQSVLKDL